LQMSVRDKDRKPHFSQKTREMGHPGSREVGQLPIN
jgi:hypothetical protein